MTGVSSSSRRILALFLPRLATDRLHRRAKGASWLSSGLAPDEPPLAVFARVGNAFRLEAVDARAAALGLAVHQPLAEARARVPSLALVERDEEGEAETLEAIADWCDRFTPLVGLDRDFDGEAGLFLDASGVAHLFGGEGSMAEEVVTRLAGNGFEVRAAIAGSAAAARAVVRYGLGEARTRVAASGEDRAAVAALPLAAIDPDGVRRAALARLGLANVADLLALPRAALARRFGADLLLRLDEAVGEVERPISPRAPIADLTAERRFFEPISTPEDVAAVARSLAGAVAESLERRGEGATMVELALWRVDGDVRRIRVGAGRPLRDPDLLLSLFAERLKGMGEDEPRRGRRGTSSDSGFRIAYGMEPGYGFDLVRLSVIAAVALDPAQADLSGDATARLAFERLVDRLGARLGSRRIGVAEPVDTHVPEDAAALVPVGAARVVAWGTGAAADEPPERPVRLLERPEPIDTVAEIPDGPPLRFRWRRVLYEVERAEGPERIATPWWRAPPEESLDPAAPANDDGGAMPRLDVERATRDYFRIEDASGRRFWIFRAGLFGRETVRPRWFVHGLFA
jgi:protein ImuB